jgi:hypothetical protein
MVYDYRKNKLELAAFFVLVKKNSYISLTKNLLIAIC